MSIGLIPVGRTDRDLVEMLKDGISVVFHRPVLIGEELPKPDYVFNKRRNQHLSTAILDMVREHAEYSDYERILGIVDHDLCVPELNFVFGQASGRVAVIALARLRQEFYALPANRNLFHKRTLTEAVRELGHTYGLTHCSKPRCVMFFSNTLQDTDRKSSEFCLQCQGKLG